MSLAHASTLVGGPRDPLRLLLLQLVIVVVAARFLGRVSHRLGQPSVIGEIVARLVLGPSLFGALAPDAFAALFPASSLPTLKLFADIGLVLFLFVVGLEIDVARLRHAASTVVAVSHASIVVPWLLGVVLALFLYRGFAPVGVSFASFAVFLGIAMSISAFPVLARILTERRLAATYLGATALTCAAADDLTVWTMLTVFVSVVGIDGAATAFGSLAMILSFIIVMLWAVRPLLARVFAAPEASMDSAGMGIAFVVMLILGSALTTEALGIHALFGAFLTGAVMPRDARLREALLVRVNEVNSVLLLPIFFVVTGLRAEIELVNEAQGWAHCAVIILLATLGKIGGSMVAARLTRLDWIDAFTLGALMNTRGLMELVVLAIGLEIGILSPRIYTMMVLMALTTTFATGPLLSLAAALRRRRPVSEPDPVLRLPGVEAA